MNKFIKIENWEKTLPEYLKHDIEVWVNKKEEKKYNWDLYWGELYGSINSALFDGIISDEEARYLRDKYLGI